jgi:hypothetical protein
VHLARPIKITDFTLEHIPRSIAYDMSSAPKDVIVEVCSCVSEAFIHAGIVRC